jgi:hypothetical protein
MTILPTLEANISGITKLNIYLLNMKKADKALNKNTALYNLTHFSTISHHTTEVPTSVLYTVGKLISVITIYCIMKQLD